MKTVFVMAKSYKYYINFLRSVENTCLYTSTQNFVYLNDVTKLRVCAHINILKYGEWQLNPAYTNDFLNEMEYWHRPTYVNEPPTTDPILELFNLPL